MKPNLLTEYKVRRQVVELLSEEEAARLEKVLSTGILQDGEEYIEIDHVSLGVQRARAGMLLGRSRLILRRALDASTWNQLVTVLDGTRQL
jgi:hypothetical protein